MNNEKPEQNLPKDASKTTGMEHSEFDSELTPESDQSKDHPKKTSPEVEPLPMGTGYQVNDLPVEVAAPPIILTEAVIPDLVKEAQMIETLDEPIPAPEDEFYDFEKDIYGDETEFKP
ncbi:MAG: hypothetical protein WAV55_04180 [Clostridiaceae bacterium]